MAACTTNSGGMPELNVDGKTGFLCNVGDVETMAEKALYILGDAKVLKEFKKNALKRAKEFDINVIVPRYEKFYQRVLSQSAK